ncbi:MAG: hypothetical protein V1726_01570 [Methanobacteriota archaeon]
MEKPLKEIHSQDHTVWVTQPHELKSIMRRAETALDVAKVKFFESHGNIELVMQTAEAFGRGLYAEFIKKKPKEWTMKQWLEATTKDVLNPLGTGATFTRITEKEAQSFMFRSLLQEKSENQEMASLFTYGFMRGMLKSAFPKGEVLMRSTMVEGAPMSEFIFKVKATEVERLERERVKHFFAPTMRI